MQQSSYLLRPWQTYENTQYAPYRPHLRISNPISVKNKQNIIKKPLKIQVEPQKKYDILQGKQILSVKLIRNRIKTQEPISNYLNTLKFKDFKQLSQFKMKSQPKQQSNFIQKKTKKAVSMQKIIPLLQKQEKINFLSPVHKIKNLSSKHKHQLNHKKRSISSHSLNKQQKKSQIKFKINLSQKYFMRNKWNKQTIQPQSKIKNALSFNNTSIFNNEIINTSLKKIEMTQKDDITKKRLQIRLKQVLQKSNRKKRLIEESMKSRMMIGKKQISDRINLSKIEHMFISDLQDLAFEKGQFNDQNLYKPWIIKSKGTFFNNNTIQ